MGCLCSKPTPVEEPKQASAEPVVRPDPAPEESSNTKNNDDVEVEDIESPVLAPHRDEMTQAGGSRMIVCYMCGMKYGPTSLPIHQRECPKKREANQRILPEDLRKPIPSPPSLPLPHEHDKPSVFAEYNEEAEKIFRESMNSCEQCGRRFEPDRLLVHIKSCKGKKKK